MASDGVTLAEINQWLKPCQKSQGINHRERSDAVFGIFFPEMTKSTLPFA